jgi:hypothetical protein
MLKVESWIFVDEPSTERHEDRFANEAAFAATVEAQQEAIRNLELEPESNKDIADYKGNGERIS